MQRQADCSHLLFECTRLVTRERQKIKRAALEFELAYVRARQGIELVNQDVERQYLAQHRRDYFRCCGAQPILHRFELRAQYRQRGAQFVRCIGNPLAAGCFGLAQRYRQLVEAARQVAQFIATVIPKAGLEAAVGQRSGTCGQAQDRRAEVRRQQHCHQGAQCNAERGDDQEALFDPVDESARHGVTWPGRLGHYQKPHWLAVNLDGTAHGGVGLAVASRQIAPASVDKCDPVLQSQLVDGSGVGRGHRGRWHNRGRQGREYRRGERWWRRRCRR